MYPIRLIILPALLITSVCTLVTPSAYAQAQDSLTITAHQAAVRAARISQIRNAKGSNFVTFKSGNKYNFSGGWHGRLILGGTNCVNVPGSVPFRHIIYLIKNAVRVDTSSDGSLYGKTRDGGKRLEASKGFMRSDGTAVGVAVIYKNLKPANADLGYGIALQKGNARCSAGFFAKAIRAF